MVDRGAVTCPLGLEQTEECFNLVIEILMVDRGGGADLSSSSPGRFNLVIEILMVDRQRIVLAP